MRGQLFQNIGFISQFCGIAKQSQKSSILRTKNTNFADIVGVHGTGRAQSCNGYQEPTPYQFWAQSDEYERSSLCANFENRSLYKPLLNRSILERLPQPIRREAPENFGHFWSNLLVKTKPKKCPN